MTRAELFMWCAVGLISVTFLLQAFHVLGVDTPEGVLLDASFVVGWLGVLFALLAIALALRSRDE